MKKLLLSASILLSGVTFAFAARTITTATLDGVSTASVAPGGSITAIVTGTLSSNDDWNSTAWSISSGSSASTCADTNNHNNNNTSGLSSGTFTITAPSTPGTYNANFQMHDNNSCGGGSSSVFSLSNAITVLTPTSSGANPGTTVSSSDNSGGASWNNTSAVFASDNNRATSSLSNSGGGRNSDYLNITGFGFSIPSGATITGIEVTPEYSASVANLIRTETVQMIKAGSRTGTAFDGSGDPYNWPTIDTTSTYGGSTDLWGTTWTPAQVNASNFGVAFVARHDSSGSTAEARVDQIKITVYYVTTASNAAPVANAQTVTTNEDNAVAITLTGTDGDGNTLTYATTSSPANGVLTGTAPNLTFNPSSNFNGTTTFTFKVNDGTVDSSNAIVTVVVNAVNDAPSFLNAGNRTVDEDSGVFSYENWATAMSAGPSDEASQILSFLLTPSVASLFSVAPSVSATGTLYFTPAANKNGSTSITAKIQDDGGTANGGDNESEDTFTITINSVNDDPVLGEIANATTTEGSSFNFTATATDEEDNDTTFFFSLSGEPDGATIGVTSGIFSWLTDESDGPGLFTFTVHVSDGDGGSDSQEITLAVTEVNQTPSVTSQEVSTHINTPRTIEMIASDDDFPTQTLIFATTSSPAYGVLSGFSGDEITYTPPEDWSGEVQFNVVVTDGVATSSPAIIVINVNNTAPNLSAIDDVPVTEGDTVHVSVTAADEDNDPETQDTLTFSIAGDVPDDSDFQFNTETGAISWETDENDDGVYELSITVSDGVDQDTQSFTVTVSESNEPPIAQGQGELIVCQESEESEQTEECENSVEGGVQTDEDEGVSITVEATDSDVVGGDEQALEYAVVTTTENGTLEQKGGNEFFYTPNENWYGIDSFTFEVSDGVATSIPATVYITVGAVNDLPVITLIGSNPLVYVFGETEGVLDPGAIAFDVEDGELVATSSRAINADRLEDYTVTYSATDNDGATATVDRAVVILNSRVGGSGSGQVGCRDPRATNYNPAATYDGVACVYPQVLGASTSTEPLTGAAGTSTDPMVLGATTTCSAYIPADTKVLRRGLANNSETVKLLQSFINSHMGRTIPLTGFFGPLTEAGVRAFQSKYKDIILAPWGLTSPTGVAYKTTLNHINNLVCPELNLRALPADLIPLSGR